MHLNICNGSWADHFISRGGGIRTPLTPYSSPRMQLLWLWMRSVKILLFTLVSFYITCWSNPRMFWKQQWRNEARECLDMVRWGNSTSMQLSDILKVSCFAIILVVIIRYVASGGDKEGQGRSLIFMVKFIYIKKKNFERTDPFQSYSRVLIIDIVWFWFLFIYI